MNPAPVAQPAFCGKVVNGIELNCVECRISGQVVGAVEGGQVKCVGQARNKRKVQRVCEGRGACGNCATTGAAWKIKSAGKGK